MKLIEQNKELTDFPEIPKGVTELSVFNNKIRYVPEELWEERGLQTLNLSMNQIEEISP